MIYPCPKPEKKKKKQWYDGKKVKEMFRARGITRCECGLDGCKKTEWLTFAHRHKRRWYLNKGDLINDFKQIILACIHCHEKLEKDPELTRITFNRLRENESN